MRILVVSQHYWPENFRITDICKGFTANNIEVDVLCGLPNYPQGEWFDGYGYFKNRKQVHDGVNVYRAGEIRRKNNSSIRIFLNYVSYPFTACFNLFRLIGKRYDAVFCYNTSPVLMMIPAILYSKLTGTPLTTYVLDLWPENLYSVLPIQNSVLRKIAAGVSHFLYRRSDKLIAMSPSLQEKLQKIAPKRIVTTIPQYCEDFYAQDAFDKDLQTRFAGKFNIVFAGNFSPAQNLDLLVDTAMLLKKANYTEVRFILCGNGMSYEQIVKSVQQNDLTDYFCFEGRIDPQDVPKYHTLADALFAGLAKSEDLGLTVPAKIASYMAAARPLLVAIDGEACTAVNAAMCGLTSEAGNAQALCDNIIKIIGLPKTDLETMGHNSKEYYLKNYKRSNILQKLIEFIKTEV